VRSQLAAVAVCPLVTVDRYRSAGSAGHRPGSAVSLGGGQRGQECVGEQGQDGPPVPGGQLRTWCSSRAASSLPPANPSSTFQRDPATFTGWAGGVGAVEGVLAVADAAADQQPVRAAAGDRCRSGASIRAQSYQPGALGAGPGRHPLPGPGGSRFASSIAVRGPIPGVMRRRLGMARTRTRPRRAG
jgi:hypothetical protein